MNYCVYTLVSLKDKGFYSGFTTNLKDRLARHKRGEVKSTTGRRPLKLIHCEYFLDKQDAMAREKFLKSGFGRSQLREALKRTLSKHTAGWPALTRVNARQVKWHN